MKTTTTIKIENLDKVLNKLAKRVTAYPTYMAAVLRDATDYAADVAGSDLGSAVFCHKGQTSVMGYTARGSVEADGAAVVFLEFGAGDLAGVGQHGDQILNFEQNSGILVHPGSYLKNNGPGEYYRTMNSPSGGHWHFGGQVYHFIQPRRGMYHAAQDLKTELANADSHFYQDNKALLG